MSEGRSLTWRLLRVAHWRYSAIFLVDALIVCFAFYLGFLLRFEGHVPPDRTAQFQRYLPLLLAIRLPLHWLFGIHRWSFRLSGLHEALRVVLTSLTGSACFGTVLFFLQREAASAAVGPPRSVIAIEFFVTTSLLGAPVEGISPAELTELYALLLGSGLDITAMNRIRKRFSRWGGGRLALALAPARVRVYVVSDVIGDDLASIGSGPCVPDPSTVREVRDLLERSRLWERVPESARRQVREASEGTKAETPKPGDPAFARVTLELIASNGLALEAAAKRAAELGLVPVVESTPLAGEASAAGTSVAATLLQDYAAGSIPQRRCRIWGGETTVTLGEAPPGLGGRCQELALSAARVLAGAPRGVSVLAAGTDGRDGPTDAAGAIVDGNTWTAIAAAGRDPARDLAAHDAYRALDAAGVLLRPGLTGTNVMDVVIGVCVDT